MLTQARFRLIPELENTVDASEAACDAYGYTEAELRQLSLTNLRADPVSKETADNECAAGCGDETALYETLQRHKDGHVFPAEVKSGLVVIGDKLYRQSFVRDISERQAAQAALRTSEQFGRSTIDAIAAHICVIDRQGAIVAVNQPWNTFAEENSKPDATSSGDFPRLGLGCNYLHVCDAATGAGAGDAASMAAGIRAVMRGEMQEFVLEYSCHSPTEQHWFMARVTRFAGSSGNCVIAHTKATERKEFELALLRRTRALKALSALNRALITVQTESDLLQSVCDVIVERGGYRMVLVGIAEHDADKSVRVVAHAGFYQGYFDQTSISWADTPNGRGPIGRAIRSGTVEVSHDLMVDPHMAPWHDAAMQRGYHSVSVMPLIVDGLVMGALTVFSSDPNAFDEPELELLEELSRDLTYGVATIRSASQRVALEAALLASEAQFRSLIEQFPIGIHVLHDGVCTYTNPRMDEIMGSGLGGLLGARVEALVMPESSGAYAHAKEQLATQGRTGNFLMNVKRNDGMVTTLGIQYVKGRFLNETVSIGMAQDVSERERDKAEIQRYIKSLEHATEATLQSVAVIVEKRDPYTAGHERRVGELAAAIGKEMGLSEHQIKGLRLAGFVHDVGKIAVPAELLAKPTRLTDIEMALIRVHAQAGYDVLKGVEFPWPIAEVALQHHERLDGSGYPNGLKGDEILLESRIMSVADVVESMFSHRPYRPGLGIDAALAEIEQFKGSRYDAQVVAACNTLFLERGYKFPT